MAKRVGMANRYGILGLLAGCLLAQSCNILPGGLNSGGVCQTPDGRAVTTYTPYGTWKKTFGYIPPRTELELTENYEVLIVLRNGETCRIRFENDADTGERTGYYSFSNDVNLKTITMTLLQSDVENTANRLVDYSFKGSCGDTEMTWSGTTDSLTETFKYRSKNLEGVACSSSQ